MEACLATKGFVFPAGWNTSSLFRKRYSGPVPGLFAEGRGLSNQLHYCPLAHDSFVQSLNLQDA